MRNLKKVLALVVAVAMIASMGIVASAANYTDVASNASYADAVNLLSNLGIINGFEDGTFRPTDTVTRAQAAKMIVCMLGLADEVEQGESDFTDVKAEDWFSGYVNVAAANGIINGMGDGTFNPNGELTYGQIVKMIVCALGYAPVAEANGGYLGGGYLYAASNRVTGFTTGVSGTANAAASRATVARLIYNALEVELMEQETFTTGSEGASFKKQTGKTILSEYLELEKIEGVVVSTYLSNSSYEEGDNTVAIVITKNYTNDNDKGDYAAGEKVAFVADGTDAATLLGYTVTAYVGSNDDDEDTLFAVAPKSGKNTVMVLDTELIAKDADALTADSVKYYKSETSKNSITAKIENTITVKSADAEHVVNNFVVNGFNDETVSANDVLTALADGTLEEITFIDNNNDGNFEFVMVTMPTNKTVEFVVEEIEAEDYYLAGSDFDDKTADLAIDYDNASVLYTIVKDGRIVGFDAIAEGDVVTVLDPSVNVVTVYVSSASFDGTVDELDGDTYTINGKEYNLAKEGSLEIGSNGTFRLNAFGKIAYADVDESVTGSDYVYLVAADQQNVAFGTDYLVKLVTVKGAVETLKIRETKATVVAAEAEGGKQPKLTDNKAYDIIKAAIGEEGTIARIKTTTAGEISEVYLPGAENFVVENAYAPSKGTNDKKYNPTRNTYGVYDLAPSVVVFNISQKKDSTGDLAALEERVTASTVANIFEEGSSYVFTAYGTSVSKLEAIVADNAKSAIDAEAPVMVVTKKSKVTVDDVDTIKLTGVVAGKTVTVVVDPDETAVDVEVGNVVLYAETANYVTDVKVLVESTKTEPGTGISSGDLGDILVGTPSKDDVTVHFGELKSNRDKEDATAAYFYLDGAKYYLAKDYNITVVDYTGANMTVNAGRTTDLKASKKDTVTKTAFIKTAADAEDEATDIVVFISNVVAGETEK